LLNSYFYFCLAFISALKIGRFWFGGTVYSTGLLFLLKAEIIKGRNEGEKGDRSSKSLYVSPQM